MGTFLSVLNKSLQVDINIGRAGLGLCSMRSTVGELFAALLTQHRLVSLVNKHRLFARHDLALVDGKDLVR